MIIRFLVETDMDADSQKRSQRSTRAYRVHFMSKATGHFDQGSGGPSIDDQLLDHLTRQTLTATGLIHR